MGRRAQPAKPSTRRPRRAQRAGRPSTAPPPPTFLLASPEGAESAVETYRAGDLCPNCGFARLTYDGYFNLFCPICGFRTGARGACT